MVAEPDPDWRHVDTLHTMYAAAMTRLEAGTNFRLPRDHWDRVRDALADRAQLWVLKYAGEVIAIDLVTEHDGIVQSLHGAMEPDQQRKFSMLPVYDSLLEWPIPAEIGTSFSTVPRTNRCGCSNAESPPWNRCRGPDGLW